MNHDLEPFATTPASVIICLGSSDLRVAVYAARLFQEGVADWLLFSGGMGTGMHSGANLLGWKQPEAEVFAAEAMRCGVDKERILVEPASKNTGENIRLSHDLLAEKGVLVESIVLVTKPFMERRALATFMKQWPTDSTESSSSVNDNTRSTESLSSASPVPLMRVSSPPASWPNYIEGSGLARDDIVSILVGDVQRLTDYAAPPHDFQIPQVIPSEVNDAFERLVACGYDGNMIKPPPMRPPVPFLYDQNRDTALNRGAKGS